jgi:peptidoglycan LD-endopeptidase LytH
MYRNTVRQNISLVKQPRRARCISGLGRLVSGMEFPADRSKSPQRFGEILSVCTLEVPGFGLSAAGFNLAAQVCPKHQIRPALWGGHFGASFLGMIFAYWSKVRARWIGVVLTVFVLVLLILLLRFWRPAATPQLLRLRAWFADPVAHAQWAIRSGTRCGDALMLMPTDGYIGFGWNDSFRPGHHHSGLDIFSPDGAANITPVVAAYDGYLTREADWKSTVIIRHPNFPAVAAVGISAGEEIWTYYTHMASRDGSESFIAPHFPPGTRELFVKAGTLLGYQGNWAGSQLQFTGLHLHFSVVKSDADGDYMDEREIENTYDPIPLLGLSQTPDQIWVCAEE